MFFESSELKQSYIARVGSLRVSSHGTVSQHNLLVPWNIATRVADVLDTSTIHFHSRSEVRELVSEKGGTNYLDILPQGVHTS
jgi:hypothetical protein